MTYVSNNVKNYVSILGKALDGAAQSGEFDDVDASLVTPLPEAPPGMMWDSEMGRFMQRPGFEGREMTDEIQKWIAVSSPAYKLADRAQRLSAVGRQLKLESSSRQREIEIQEERFRQNMLTGQIDSAEEAMAKRTMAEQQEIQDKRKYENLQLLIGLIQNPVSLAMAKRHGLLGQIEGILGIDMGRTVDVPLGDGIVAPTAEEWNNATPENQAITLATFMESGMSYFDFERMIKEATLGAGTQAIRYGTYEDDIPIGVR
jgi:hypothetical protein